jgi:transposase
MALAIGITRTDLDAAGLRREAGRSRDASAARRMLALALVMDGKSRTEAAQAAGMDRQTLRDWVHRYNDEGLAELSDRHGGGTRPFLSSEQEAELAQWVTAGAKLSRARCGALAAGRSGACDRSQVRHRAGRAQHERRAAPARLSPPCGPAAPSWSQRRGASVFQGDFPARVGPEGPAT